MLVSTLPTKFILPTEDDDLCFSASLADVVGYLGREARLNDAVLMFGLRIIASAYSTVHVVDSLRVAPVGSSSGMRGYQPFKMPSRHWDEVETILIPLNFDNAHWCILCANVSDPTPIQVFLYDPLQGGHVTRMKRAWVSDIVPFVRRWCDRDEQTVPTEVDLVVARARSQHDGTSCGVYCLAFADEFTRERVETAAWAQSEYDRVVLDRETATERRAVLMWQILCRSVRTDRDDEVEKAQASMQELEAFNGA